jgi:hypothetical protein
MKMRKLMSFYYLQMKRVDNCLYRIGVKQALTRLMKDRHSIACYEFVPKSMRMKNADAVQNKYDLDTELWKHWR